MRNPKLFLGIQPICSIVSDILSYIPHKTVTDVTDADYIVFPQHIPSGAVSEDMALTLVSYKYYAEDFNKTLIIFVMSDFTDPFKGFDNSIIYRTSLYRSECLKHERILPYLWINNCFYKIKPIINNRPRINFCGAITYPQRIFELEAILTSCDKWLDCDFTIRDKPWGEGVSNAHQEFFNGLSNAQFICCPRGVGNFSIRFYETLCAGRIPVFVNTDMILPFEGEINWNDVAVIAPNIDELPNCLINFIKRKNLVESQILCRDIYDKYLSPAKFGEYLHRCMSSGKF
jgi:hypothetical protein